MPEIIKPFKNLEKIKKQTRDFEESAAPVPSQRINERVIETANALNTSRIKNKQKIKGNKR